MKLLYSFLKDVRLSLRGFYFYVELGMALVFVAVMLFVVPEKFEPRITVYAYVDLTGVSRHAAEQALAGERYRVMQLDSRQAVEEKLAGDRSAVGLVMRTEGGKVVCDYILQGYEGRRLRNIIKSSIEASFARKMPGFRSAVEVVTVEGDAEKLPDRVNILPVYLALNAAFMGLFIIASYVFLDKEEGTIKAFAVTPARVWQYLASKMGVLLITGLLSGLFVTAAVAGTRAHYLHLAFLLAACNVFGSALGLVIASFFDTMSKAMGWLYLSIIVLAFASVSYFLPAFSPPVIRLLPSYPMLFAFREALVTHSDLGYLYRTAGGFLLAGMVLFGMAVWRFERTLTV